MILFSSFSFNLVNVFPPIHHLYCPVLDRSIITFKFKFYETQITSLDLMNTFLTFLSYLYVHLLLKVHYENSSK